MASEHADLPQERRLVTDIPGPRSLALHGSPHRGGRQGVAASPAGLRRRAGGGVIVDVDGNPLIDLGSGIAVTNVGNANPPVVAAVAEQVARFTHTCFMITPYEGYVEVCEALNRITPGDHEKRSALFNSGAEAVENAVKIARHATGRHGGGRARPRLPRPHQPDDGPDRQEHAVQAGLRPVRRRGLPGADGLPVPLAGRPGGLRPRRPPPRPST